jgi:hypothetical protein
LLDDAHYYDSACRHTSPRFHLREGAVPGAAPPPRGTPARPPDGLCPELTEWWHGRYGHLIGASEFTVDRVSENGRTAEARSSLGRAGLEVVEGEWRLLWIEG